MSLVALTAFFVWNSAEKRHQFFAFSFRTNKSGLAKYHFPNYGSFLRGFLLDENSDKLRPCHSNIFATSGSPGEKRLCRWHVRTTSSAIRYRLVLVRKKPNDTKLCLFQSSGWFGRFRQTQKNNYLTQPSSVQIEANIHWLLCEAKNFDCFTETPSCQT